MKIETAAEKYVGKISLMYQDFFIHNASQQPAYYRAAVESGQYPKSVIESDREELIAATEDDIVLGFIHIAEEQTPPYGCFIPHRYAVCVDLYVAPDYRKKGIGTKLILAAKQWAENRNLDYLELNVLAENENAFHLYQQVGFQTVSHLMRYTL